MLSHNAGLAAGNCRVEYLGCIDKMLLKKLVKMAVIAVDSGKCWIRMMLADIDVDQIISLQIEATERWHSEPLVCTGEGLLWLVCHQHSFNFQLWHQEDIARSPQAAPEAIAEVKRKIDQLNQQRNDAIERLDDWLAEQLLKGNVKPQQDARLNTETPGSAIDRLSIMALRIYHYDEQLRRESVESMHRQRVLHRLVLCRQQHADLSQSLKELLSDIIRGLRRHKTYRQLKMYNDPGLNPYLYERQNGE